MAYRLMNKRAFFFTKRYTVIISFTLTEDILVTAILSRNSNYMYLVIFLSMDLYLFAVVVSLKINMF